MIKANQLFQLDNNETVTVSFWAKATASGKRLVPFIQETVNSQYQNMGDYNLTTAWKWYSFTAPVSTITSNNYQIKFRGYSTAWIYLDKVQVGPPDWRTLLKIELQYLNTPTFLPNTPPSQGLLVNTPEILPGKDSPVKLLNAGGLLFVSGTNENATYHVYDISGRQMISGSGKRINVSRLNRGIYILHIGGQKVRFFKD